MSDDLFEEGTGEDKGEPSPSDKGPLCELSETNLDKWVGEGKKFSSVEELVKSYDNSQQFIEQLKQENADMRREVSSTEKLDKILDRIEASGASAPAGRDEGTPGATPSDGTGQDKEANIEERISEAVQREVTRLESQRTAQQNLDSASEELLKVTDGNRDEAKTLLKQTARDLGVSVSYLQKQAEVSPSAFSRMVSASKTEGGAPSGAGGSHNPEAFETKSFRSPDSEVQPWSHWQKKKREMSRAEFYSPKIQNQIFKSRQQLGDSFFDTS